MPHHRTCGSANGGSEHSLPTVFAVNSDTGFWPVVQNNPQRAHIGNPLFVQPAVSQGTLDHAVATHPPVPVAPLGSPQVRTRWLPLRFAPLPPCGWLVSAAPRLPARPPHFPPRADPPPAEPLRLDLTASLCCASSSRRARPSMRFLSVSPLVSASLPSPGRLPFRSWPRVAGLSCHHAGSSYRGLAPHLHRAHDGRTQEHA